MALKNEEKEIQILSQEISLKAKRVVSKVVLKVRYTEIEVTIVLKLSFYFKKYVKFDNRDSFTLKILKVHTVRQLS